MGYPKALLPWEGTTLIRTVTDRLRPLFRRVLVVAQEGQDLGDLDVEVLADSRPEQGPLVGLATGLAASEAPWCFVVGCDMPFLRADVIDRMARGLDDSDILAPHLDGDIQTLHAFYSRACLPRATEVVDAGRRSLRALFDRCNVRALDATQLRDLDPGLLSLRDLDNVQDYQVAMQLTQQIPPGGSLVTPPVIAIVGPSDSGKTRVAVDLIRALVSEGFRITAVKHCHDGHQLDLPEKDTARLFEAGAAQMIASSPDKITSFSSTESDTPLEQIVASIGPGYDLVVAEGFKGSSVPKVLVMGKEPISPRPLNVIAVVGEDPAAEDVPCHTFDRLEGLARQVKELVQGGPARNAGASLVVDGVPIPLFGFATNVLAEVIKGVLRTLRGVPHDPQTIQLNLDMATLTEDRTER